MQKIVLFIAIFTVLIVTGCQEEAKPEAITKNKCEIKITEVSSFALSEYKGYLNLTLDIKNNFEKEVLYLVIEYSYIDKYETNYFSERAKITEVTSGEIKLNLLEEYNRASEFLYRRVPSEEVAGRAFLAEGLKIKVIGVSFKDGEKVLF